VQKRRQGFSAIMQKLGMEEGQEIEHKMVSNAIARSQKRVEGHNFDIRKHLLEYDDVMNKQRMFIYKLRNEALDENFNLSDVIKKWLEETIESQILIHCDGTNPDNWTLDGLNEWLKTITHHEVNVNSGSFKRSNKALEELLDTILNSLVTIYDSKRNNVGIDMWSHLERNIFLEILDHRWKEHLHVMDNLRDGIWTVGYGEKNPLNEYKIQGFKIFEQMVENLKNEIINFIMRVEITEPSKNQETKEYRKIGVEATNIDIFSSGITQDNSRKKNDPPASAGGSSRRKSNRRGK
jgi:preprotein translocase subunit SecA